MEAPSNSSNPDASPSASSAASWTYLQQPVKSPYYPMMPPPPPQWLLLQPFPYPYKPPQQGMHHKFNNPRQPPPPPPLLIRTRPVPVYPNCGFNPNVNVYIAPYPQQDFYPPYHVQPSYPPPRVPMNPAQATSFPRAATVDVLKNRLDRLRIQIQYYFSDKNLENDPYLKDYMDNNGWVKIETILTFPRVIKLKGDINMIKNALEYSDVVEIQGNVMRKRHGWERWILRKPTLEKGMENLKLDG